MSLYSALSVYSVKIPVQNEVCSLGGDQLGFGIIRVFFQYSFGTEAAHIAEFVGARISLAL